MRRRGRGLSRARAGVAGALLLLGGASPALAADEGAVVGVTAVFALAAADGLFTTYDLVVAAKGHRPSHGWALAETIVTAPQAAALNALVTVGSMEGKESDQVGIGFALIPTIGVTTMAMHGARALDPREVEPGVLLGSSLAIGIDIAFSSAAVGRLFDGEWATRAIGTAELALTAPQIPIFAIAAANDDDGRAGWIWMTGWSSLLALHGAASLVYDASERSYGHRARAKGPLGVAGAAPDSFRVTPAVLPGRRAMPGLIATGSF